VQSAVANGGPPLGIPNAASQRNEMIRELKEVTKSVQELRKELEGAEFNVKVTSMPAMRGSDASGSGDDGK
jgi:hypothetical protein